MTITIVAPGEYIDASKSAPIVGRSYILEDATTGTGAQNRAFHALVQEYWASGCHSYIAKNFEDFRGQIKRDLGAGFESFVYVDMVDGKAVIKDAKHSEDIPAHIRRDPDLKKLARGRLKSWTIYSKIERCRTLDALIAEMKQVGVQTKHFYEILEGMEDDE